jgi:hypothetical protein
LLRVCEDAVARHQFVIGPLFDATPASGDRHPSRQDIRTDGSDDYDDAEHGGSPSCACTRHAELRDCAEQCIPQGGLAVI